MSNQFIPKVSVIIPIYNMEKFLDETMTILLNQTLKDIELICVKDRFSDNSLEILKKYTKDDRLIIINKEHRNYKSVKKNGLYETKGEFVYFFNPGEYILSNTLEELYKNAVSNDQI